MYRNHPISVMQMQGKYTKNDNDEQLLFTNTRTESVQSSGDDSEQRLLRQNLMSVSSKQIKYRKKNDYQDNDKY